MKRNNNNEQNEKRIVLPSGRTIDVADFDENEQGAPQESIIQLHICPECGGKMVYPTDWIDVTEKDWEVCLRCPGCEWRHTGVYSQDVVDRFDEVLDLGTDDLMADLKVLERANMEDHVGRFIKALRADAVWPMDF